MSKVSIYRILILAFFYFFLGCSQPEEMISGIPRVATNEMVFTNSNGAVFEGNIISSKGNIVDHGFQWRKTGSVDIDFISGGPLTETKFSLEVNSGFEERDSYEVRAFITTTTHKAFGQWVKFSGAGSIAPLVSEISPTEGTWGDTVTITGKYFSNKPGGAIAEFNGIPSIVVSNSDSVIKVKVPFDFINAATAQIRVKVGSRLGTSNQQFSLFSTELYKLIPASAGSSTEITIIGKYLHPTSSQLLFDQVSINIKEYFRDSLKIILPKEVTPGLKDVTLISGPFTKTLAKAFRRNSPQLIEINPPLGFYGDTIVLKGENFGSKFSDNKVQVNFNGEFVNVIDVNENELKILVPIIPRPELEFVITADYVSSQSDLKFRIEKPKIEDLWPNEVLYPGQTLAIKGNNFYPYTYSYPNPYRIEIDGHLADVVSASKTELKVRVPLTASYSSTANVIQFDTTVVKSNELLITPIARKSDFPGGQRSSATSFTIGDKAYILSGRALSTIESNEVFEFNLTNKTWRTVENFPGEPRYGATAYTLDNKGYVLGGYSVSGAPLRDLWEYDPASNSWAKKNSYLFHPLEAFNLGGRIFCVSDITFIVVPPSTEISGVGYETLFWEYDKVLDSWTRRSSPSYTLKRNELGQYYFTMQVGDALIIGVFVPELNSYVYKQYNAEEDEWLDKGLTAINGISPITFDYNSNGYLLTNGYLYRYNLNSNHWQLIEKDLSELLWYGGQPNKFRFNNFWYFTLFDYNGRIFGGPYLEYKNMMYEFNCNLID